MQRSDRMRTLMPTLTQVLWPLLWQVARSGVADTAAVIATAALAVSLAALPRSADAAQTLDIRDGDTAVVRISSLDQTRVRAARARVLDVIGDVYDAQANPGGRVIVLKDDGEVYLKPIVDQGVPTRPIKLDVKTTSGTVGLLLQPAEIVGDTLTLRVAGGTPTGAGGAAANARVKSPAHLRAVKALTLAMAVPGMAADASIQVIDGGAEEVLLWQEARFVLLARYEAGQLLGETFQLTNVSKSRMVLDEREFFRPGVVSVSALRLVLEPGESTRVWVVRSTDDSDEVSAAGRRP